VGFGVQDPAAQAFFLARDPGPAGGAPDGAVLALPSVHACDTVKATQTALDEEISRPLVEDTTPLDKEVPNDPAFIRFEEGNAEPVEASLNQLIFCLTIHDPLRNTFLSELTNALCLTISSYSSSKIFLQKLRDRFAMMKRVAAMPGADANR
jgi:hypothetical protein